MNEYNWVAVIGSALENGPTRFYVLRHVCASNVLIAESNIEGYQYEAQSVKDNLGEDEIFLGTTLLRQT